MYGFLGSFEVWYWRRMKKISCTVQVRKEEVFQRAKEEKNILHAIKRRKTHWVGHILCGNCLLTDVIEGMIEQKWREDEVKT